MRKILLVVISILISYNLYSDNYPTGASSLGMGNATVAVPSLWSTFHNQGALGFLEGIQVGMYYENRFDVPEFGVKSLAFAMNTKPGTFALDFTSFGFSKFSDNKVGFAYSMKLAEYLAIGVQIDYIYIVQDSYYGNISTVSGEIGIFANPFDNFYLGAHVFNPWRSKVAQYQDERLPTIFRLGFAYDFSEIVKFSSEIEKDLDYAAMFKSGIQYEPVKNFTLRTGVSFSEKNTFLAFGIGYAFKGVTLDLAFENHPVLGFKSGVSLMYRIK
ncbi:MAG: hypothetical protein JXL97_09545 [Bacteroidales bacterium]|nr:hypothetical protein [Bacteroidales bacterium]